MTTGNWTREETILAMEFYYRCPENTHTDSHDKCKEVAADIGRSPEGLDLHLRNIKHVDTSGAAGMANASQSVKELVEEFRSKPVSLFAEATRIRASLGLAPLNCA